MSENPEILKNLDLKQYAIDHVVDAIYWIGENSQILDVNDGASRMIGFSKQELTSMSVGQINPNVPATQWPEYFDRIKKQGSMTFESEHRHKDGHHIDVEITANFIVYNGREMICSFVSDITERKHDQRMMKMMKFSMDHMADKVTWVTYDAKVVYANLAACSSLGYTMEEMLKLRIPDFDPDFPAEVWPKHWEELKKYGSHTFETRHRTKSGVIYPVEVSINYMRFGGIEYNCGFARDISNRKQAEMKVRESEEKYRLLFENMTTGFALHEVILDGQGKVVDYRFLEINPEYQRLTGLTPDIIGRTVLEVLPGTEPYWIEVFGNVAMTRVPTLYENYSKELGRWFQVWTFSPKAGQFAVIVNEITERKKGEEELRLYSLALSNSSEGMLVTDADNLIIAVNPAFTRITGYSFEEVKGKNPVMFKSGRHDQAFYQAMWNSINIHGHWQGEIWDKRKDGENQAKWVTINSILNEDGSVNRYVALFSDITEKKKSEELIWRQANFDTLTGLPNRDMFRDRLGQEVKKSIRVESPLALLLVDLDQFKEVNDTLGHAVGDLLLIEAARRISACVRESDTVARLGGDEFTIVISEISGNAHVEDVAQKMIGKLAEPFHLGNEVVYISASIGITLFPSDADDLDVLIKNADQAMYEAKKKGRNRFSYFTAELQDAAQKRLRLSNDLRDAIDAGQFSVHFQPIIELATGRIHKAEALIRWNHPLQGMVNPAEFIPLAEETGLIHEIGDFVFRESVSWAKYWRTQFAPDFQVSINKSPVQFRSENHLHVSQWAEYLRDMELPGRNIVVEITEGLLLNVESEVQLELLKLQDANIQVAIDDFGTGYSSLSYLKKFDIDFLKIDRAFVNALETDANDMALSEAIIVMAHKLGLKVIAEGVETEGQRSLLDKAGCDYAQGFLFSKPVPPEELNRMLVAQG
jgi:diguanylate cyclase (GGDEF)-like protein/PAS domain S-box-containing protein